MCTTSKFFKLMRLDKPRQPAILPLLIHADKIVTDQVEHVKIPRDTLLDHDQNSKDLSPSLTQFTARTPWKTELSFEVVTAYFCNKADPCLHR